MIDNRLVKLLERVLGESIKKSKQNYAFKCPFPPCSSSTKKKLEIKLESESESFGSWHCWVCGKSGHNIRQLFISLKVNSAILEMLNEIQGVQKKVDYHEEKEEKKTLFLPKEFQSLVIPKKTPEYRQALFYLKNKRGCNAYDILRYNIGYCESGRYAGRIIVPSYDSDGNLNFFVGRTFVDDDYVHMTPEVDRNIIGFDLLINWKEPIVLVEGVFDAITISRNAIPLFGKFLSKKLKEKIFEEEIKNIYIALDSDAKPQIYKIAEYFLNQGIKVFLVDLKVKDPNETGKKGMHEFLKNTKEITINNLIKYKIEGKSK